MNWPGLLFGVSAALALGGGALAAFARHARVAVFALAGAMLGVAGLCLAMGSGFVFLLAAILLGVLVPATLLLAVVLAPPAAPDVRPGGRNLAVAALGVTLFLALAMVLTRSAWPPAGGQLQASAEWLGSRLATDHVYTFLLTGAALALAAVGAVALLRPRGARR